MKAATHPSRKPTIELPASAPLVRITAGIGSPTQKTWNLRRAVTVIGARRPAAIVLHDEGVSNAHCVIVNTGAEVLLKDLHTTAGTLCNKERVDLTAVKDGDVITIGGTTIQIAIQRPTDENDDSGCGVEFVEPTKLKAPLTLVLEHTEKQWRIEEAVALIGRHEAAAVRLDHQNISARHAILFRFADGAAVFDLGGRGGLRVNSKACPQGPVESADRLTIGPFTLLVGAARNPLNLAATAPRSEAPSSPLPLFTPSRSPDGLTLGANPARYVAPPKSDASLALAQIETELATLKNGISHSWDRMNDWQSQLLVDASQHDKRGASLAAREAALEAREALLKGQLHDLTRLHEQIIAREQTFAEQLARIQAAQDEVRAAATQQAGREAEVEKLYEDLERRENALAQRWTRLQTATCPHCNRPTGLGRTGTTRRPG